MAEGVAAELIEDSGDFKYLTACQTPEGKALLVCIATGGGGPLPFASKFGSGRLAIVGAGAVIQFAADKGDSLVTTAIQYPRGASTINLKLSVFVTSNNMVVGSTVFRVYKNGAPTAQLVTFGPGVVGDQNITAVNAFGANVDTFDLGVENPGNAGDIGFAVEFGFDVDFF
jgi:hypothetical protein